MSKIVIAVNAMIENKHKISDVIPGTHASEVFFKFDNKYKWSIFKRTDEHYSLMFYPGPQALEYLASIEDQDWAEFDNMVVYTTKELGTRESLDSFRDLHALVTSLKYGMEEVLDDIINTLDF